MKCGVLHFLPPSGMREGREYNQALPAVGKRMSEVRNASSKERFSFVKAPLQTGGRN